MNPVAPSQDALTGIVALRGRRETWMEEVLDDHPAAQRLLTDHGSPVNLIDPGLLAGHAAELVRAAADAGVEARVYFARKANKAIALVDAALGAGHGVDVASLRELQQVVDRRSRHGRIDPAAVILTAAVKPQSLIDAAIAAGVVICVDNEDEFALLLRRAAHAGRTVKVALRLTPDLAASPPSRFGLPAATLRRLLADRAVWADLQVVGLHFHLDGYQAADRTAAAHQALDLVEDARRLGHRPKFIDIGGGVPMRYLDEPGPLAEFWQRHRGGDPMTWRDTPLTQVYPVWQELVRGEWLTTVLRGEHRGSGPLADRLRTLGVRLHLEPGRSILDGAGMTLARVEFRKPAPDGTWLIGLAMNRTQVRSAAQDFLVDPVLIPAAGADRTPPGEGYLVGAYCIEAELVTLRRMRFPIGVAVGDIVAFINTGGYLMHILESASHQIPLAVNLVRDGCAWQVDEIDHENLCPGDPVRAGESG